MYGIREFAGDEKALRQLTHSLETLHSELLSSVKIKLTSRCNLRCGMCKYWQTRTETALTTGQWMQVIDELAGLGCRKVHFSGGEVFLRPDFLDLVERGAGHGMKINLTTNGTLLTQDTTRRLVRARPNSISISLDGPSPAVHDGIRGIPGSFRRTCRTIRRILSYGERIGRKPKVRINFVAMKENFRKLPEMVALAGRLGAVELHPMPVDEKGEPRLRLSGTQIRRYNEHIAPRVLHLRLQHGFSTHRALVYPFGVTEKEVKQAKKGLYARGFYKHNPCLAPWNHLFIGWDGETYLCCMTNRRMESLGNVAASSVAEVFNGEAMKRVRAEFLEGRHHKACHRCDMYLVENATLHQALRRLDAEGAPASLGEGSSYN
ncbi:MAG: radical SAM protein [Armatimonadetes bacterium]|nr:radical SAM protein [Armatimonadota bacterium]